MHGSWCRKAPHGLSRLTVSLAVRRMGCAHLRRSTRLCARLLTIQGLRPSLLVRTRRHMRHRFGRTHCEDQSRASCRLSIMANQSFIRLVGPNDRKFIPAFGYDFIAINLLQPRVRRVGVCAGPFPHFHNDRGVVFLKLLKAKQTLHAGIVNA